MSAFHDASSFTHPIVHPRTSRTRPPSRTATLLLALLCCLLLIALPASAVSTKPLCDSGVLLMPGDDWSDGGSSDGETCVRLFVPMESLLMIDLIQPADAAPAHLGRLAAETEAPAPSRLLHRSATTQLWRLPAGEYGLWVSTDTPGYQLAPFRLIIAAALPTKGERDSEIEIEPDPLVGTNNQASSRSHIPTKGERDSEIEIEPDPLVGTNNQASSRSSVPTKGERDSEIEIEPDPLVGTPNRASSRSSVPTKGERDSEIEIEPDPIRSMGVTVPSNLAFLQALFITAHPQLCDRAFGHGETPWNPTQAPDPRLACASPLPFDSPQLNTNGSATNPLLHAYRFSLNTFRTIQLKAESASGNRRLASHLTLELFDRHGQRLAVTSGDDEGTVNLVRSLVPGGYFVRLQHADGPPPPYTLALQAIEP